MLTKSMLTNFKYRPSYVSDYSQYFSKTEGHIYLNHILNIPFKFFNYKL